MPDLESRFRQICEDIKDLRAEELEEALEDLYIFAQEHPAYREQAILVFQDFLTSADREVQALVREYLQLLGNPAEAQPAPERAPQCPLFQEELCIEKDAQDLADLMCDHPSYRDCPLYQNSAHFEVKVREIIETQDFAALAKATLQLLDRIQKMEHKIDSLQNAICIIIFCIFIVPTAIAIIVNIIF